MLYGGTEVPVAVRRLHPTSYLRNTPVGRERAPSRYLKELQRLPFLKAATPRFAVAVVSLARLYSKARRILPQIPRFQSHMQHNATTIPLVLPLVRHATGSSP